MGTVKLLVKLLDWLVLELLLTSNWWSGIGRASTASAREQSRPSTAARARSSRRVPEVKSGALRWRPVGWGFALHRGTAAG